MINEVLEKAKRENQFIGIWTYDDDDGFWSGRVKKCTDDFVVIEHFTKYGKPDGIIVEQIANIQAIDFNDGYSEVMNYLVAHNHMLDSQQEIKIDAPITDNWQYELLKPFVGSGTVVVRIQLENDNTYTGFVNNSDEETTILNCIGTEGHDESFTLYKNNDIKMIRVNDLEARKRLLLFNWRKNKNK